MEKQKCRPPCVALRNEIARFLLTKILILPKILNTSNLPELLEIFNQISTQLPPITAPPPTRELSLHLIHGLPLVPQFVTLAVNEVIFHRIVSEIQNFLLQIRETSTGLFRAGDGKGRIRSPTPHTFSQVLLFRLMILLLFLVLFIPSPLIFLLILVHRLRLLAPQRGVNYACLFLLLGPLI